MQIRPEKKSEIIIDSKWQVTLTRLTGADAANRSWRRRTGLRRWGLYGQQRAAPILALPFSLPD
jgi:hypothetical protein